jgi:hypothetical protein
MKPGFIITILTFLALYSGGCKKCYQCQDTCKKCVLTDSIFVVSTKVVCSDSFSSIPAFDAAIAADSALGYVCTATASAHNKNFCSNKPGNQDYLNYYNEGGTANCTAK